MAKTRRTKRKAPEWKSAFVSVASAELGRHGTRGGRTATIEFFDGRGDKLGDLFWHWHTR